MALSERDLFGSPFGVGDEVQIRGVVTAIVGASGNTADGYGGSADSVTVNRRGWKRWRKSSECCG